MPCTMALIASSLPGAQTATKLPLSAPITLSHPSAVAALVTSARREMTPRATTLAAMDPTVARISTPHLDRPRLESAIWEAMAA